MIMSRPLGWFWLLAIALLAWTVIGLVALLFDPVLGLGDVSKLAPELDQNQYTPGYRSEDSFAGHFGFGLKYEEVHLEFLARLFAATGPDP